MVISSEAVLLNGGKMYTCGSMIILIWRIRNSRVDK